jgi:hypothetical protein
VRSWSTKPAFATPNRFCHPDFTIPLVKISSDSLKKIFQKAFGLGQSMPIFSLDNGT